MMLPGHLYKDCVRPPGWPANWEVCARCSGESKSEVGQGECRCTLGPKHLLSGVSKALIEDDVERCETTRPSWSTSPLAAELPHSCVTSFHRWLQGFTRMWISFFSCHQHSTAVPGLSVWNLLMLFPFVRMKPYMDARSSSTSSAASCSSASCSAISHSWNPQPGLQYTFSGKGCRFWTFSVAFHPIIQPSLFQAAQDPGYQQDKLSKEDNWCIWRGRWPWIQCNFWIRQNQQYLVWMFDCKSQ